MNPSHSRRAGPPSEGLLLALVLLAGCNGWQNRADDLRQSLDRVVASGHRQKGDFVRQFGAPSTCAPLAAGELCQWGAEFADQGARAAGSAAPRMADVMRVQFDRSGSYVVGEVVGRRGEELYRGRSAAPDSANSAESTFGDCPPGQALLNGACMTQDPMQGRGGPR